jgi:hypothetical protein
LRPSNEQGVCGLAETAARDKLLASEPGGIFRRQENSDRGDVPGLTGAAERGLGDGDLLEIRSDEAAAVGAFGLDYARTEGVDPDLLRSELAGQHAGDGIDRALSAGVNRATWRCDAADKGANVDDTTPHSEVVRSDCVNFLAGDLLLQIESVALNKLWSRSKNARTGPDVSSVREVLRGHLGRLSGPTKARTKLATGRVIPLPAGARAFPEAQPREWAPPANSSSEGLRNNSEASGRDLVRAPAGQEALMSRI